MKVFVLFALLTAITLSFAVQGSPRNQPHRYAVAEIPTPGLNTPNFSDVFGGKDGSTLHLDKSGLIRKLEFIAIPTTVFQIKKVITIGNHTIYQVTTEDYPYPTKKGYFIDSRFVKTVNTMPTPRQRELPDKHDIINLLIAAEGTPYLWGGNYRTGIPQMLSFYPPRQPISQGEKSTWMLKGLDCSGLLYEATNGVTPRNTSSLVTFGDPVSIAHLNANQIIHKLKPLDILVWEGHVIIVIDRRQAIESRLDYDSKLEGNQGGVRIRLLKEVLNEILKERLPVDDYFADGKEGKKRFVVRRWYKIR